MLLKRLSTTHSTVTPKGKAGGWLSVTWQPSAQRSFPLYQGPVKTQELFSSGGPLPAGEDMALC